MDRAALVRLTVQRCKRCPLCSVGHGPVPYRGPVPARYAIQGEAPGRQEDLEGLPFVGPSGRLLAEALTGVGLDINEALVFNTVSCWPNGTPDDVSIDACKPNVSLQLKLASTKYLLVLGGVALSRWVRDIKIGDVRGEFYLVPGRFNWMFYMPTWHPSFILRQGANRKLRGVWTRDLQKFADAVRDEEAEPTIPVPAPHLPRAWV